MHEPQTVQYIVVWYSQLPRGGTASLELDVSSWAGKHVWLPLARAYRRWLWRQIRRTTWISEASKAAISK